MCHRHGSEIATQSGDSPQNRDGRNGVQCRPFDAASANSLNTELPNVGQCLKVRTESGFGSGEATRLPKQLTENGRRRGSQPLQIGSTPNCDPAICAEPELSGESIALNAHAVASEARDSKRSSEILSHAFADSVRGNSRQESFDFTNDNCPIGLEDLARTTSADGRGHGYDGTVDTVPAVRPECPGKKSQEREAPSAAIIGRGSALPIHDDLEALIPTTECPANPDFPCVGRHGTNGELCPLFYRIASATRNKGRGGTKRNVITCHAICCGHPHAPNHGVLGQVRNLTHQQRRTIPFKANASPSVKAAIRRVHGEYED